MCTGLWILHLSELLNSRLCFEILSGRRVVPYHDARIHDRSKPYVCLRQCG